jgi:hypothetical protein
MTYRLRHVKGKIVIRVQIGELTITLEVPW